MISGVVGRVKEQPKSRFAMVGAGLMLLASAPFGGLSKVPIDDRVETDDPGDVVVAAPFEFKINRAVAVDEIEGVTTPSDEASHLMVLLLDVTNTDDTWVYGTLLSPVSRADSFLDRNLVVLDDRLAPDGYSTVYNAIDNSTFASFNPDLTYQVAIVWEFAGAVPKKLPMGIASLNLRPSTISPGVLEWTDAAAVAKVTLDVVDKTGTVQP